MKITSTTRAFLILVCLLTATPSADAAPPSGEHWCGTAESTLEVSRARHDASQRRAERERRAGRAPLKSAPTVYQDGHIAIIQDDGTILAPPKPFDLQGRAMQFLRRPKGVSGVRSHLTYKQLIGEKIEIGDDDSVRINFPAGFRFPFGDQVYTSLWLNSDGNLTFGRPDSASTARSLQRLLEGPPRVAPLFADLDATAATGDGGVYVAFPPNRVRITWLEVPYWGTQELNTVQVTLFETGRVNFAYGDAVEANEAIVGVSPFGNGVVHLMDYNEELPFRPPQRLAIAEEFTNREQFDDLAVGETFLQHFEDRYTYLITWLDFPYILLGGGTVAFELTVHNDTRGIGEALYNVSSSAGSDGTLESYILMGGLNKYSADPDAIFQGNATTISILGHEVGHRWLAKPRFIDRNGNQSFDLIKSDLAHWSFFLDADGSVMMGNDWVEEADGSFRSTDRATTHYSAFDQYLMGLAPPGAVPEFFYIDNPNTGSPDDFPAVGSIRQGDRVDVTVDDVIAAIGPRIPASARAPKSFRMAFVLVSRDGQPVSQESIDKLDGFRRRWLDWFQEATDFRATAKTALFPK